jgi:hypothetical protein
VSEKPFMAKMGRPKQDVVRDKQTSFYITKSDAELLDDLARGLGFQARSKLITAIIEGLIDGGFSVPAFIRLGNAINNRLEKHGYPRQIDLGLIFRPPPIFPASEMDMTPEEIREHIGELQKQLKRKERDVRSDRKAAPQGAC